MTLEERVKGFMEAMKQVESQFGVTVVATAQTEDFGKLVQVRPVIVVVPIEGWVAPAVVHRHSEEMTEAEATNDRD